MTVYVDDARIPYQRGHMRMRMSHMVADTADELHAMADRIGVKRKYFQAHASHPHYDICEAKRRAAVEAGAEQVTQRELVLVIRALRAKAPARSTP